MSDNRIFMDDINSDHTHTDTPTHETKEVVRYLSRYIYVQHRPYNNRCILHIYENGDVKEVYMLRESECSCTDTYLIYI